MKITFSSIDSRGAYLSYKVASQRTTQKRCRFKIVSYALNGFDDFKLNVNAGALINDNLLSLITHDKRLPGELRLGNKSINQLRLQQLGFFIPDTVILDFSFFDTFKKIGQVDLEAIYKQHIAEWLGSSLAIRCSSNLEDGEKQSFAGVFDTYLDVPNKFVAFKEKFCDLTKDSAQKMMCHRICADMTLSLGSWCKTWSNRSSPVFCSPQTQ